MAKKLVKWTERTEASAVIDLPEGIADGDVAEAVLDALSAEGQPGVENLTEGESSIEIESVEEPAAADSQADGSAEAPAEV
jgi:hypothetical protein